MSEEKWEVEDIPDKDFLYYRIHKRNFIDGVILPGAFMERGEGDRRGMSTNWSKYSNPEDLINIATVPSDNGVGELNVGEIRKIEGSKMAVVHDPIVGNRAHSHVLGIPREGGKQLKTEARLKLRSIFSWIKEAPDANS